MGYRGVCLDQRGFEPRRSFTPPPSISLCPGSTPFRFTCDLVYTSGAIKLAVGGRASSLTSGIRRESMRLSKQRTPPPHPLPGKLFLINTRSIKYCYNSMQVCSVHSRGHEVANAWRSHRSARGLIYLTFSFGSGFSVLVTGWSTTKRRNPVKSITLCEWYGLLPVPA